MNLHGTKPFLHYPNVSSCLIHCPISYNPEKIDVTFLFSGSISMPRLHPAKRHAPKQAEEMNRTPGMFLCERPVPQHEF